jgi:hypothetical protein
VIFSISYTRVSVLHGGVDDVGEAEMVIRGNLGVPSVCRTELYPTRLWIPNNFHPYSELEFLLRFDAKDS